MDRFNRKNVRCRDEDSQSAALYKQCNGSFASERTFSLSDSVKKGSYGLLSFGRSLRTGVSKDFDEDYNVSKKKMLDPNSNFVQRWNKIFLVSCLAALFVDPLFFFLPAISGAYCIKIQWTLKVVVTILRTITDTFYLFHMALQFRTAYVAPFSRVFGRGVLVKDPTLIAKHYLENSFSLDLIAVLPIPQVVIWIVIPALKGPIAYQTKNALRYIIVLQFIPRLILLIPLTRQIYKTTGVVTETAWAGAAYNLVLYILASHFIGACWYLLAIERKDTCWRMYCKAENGTGGQPKCLTDYLYCDPLPASEVASREIWQSQTQVPTNCLQPTFNFGIYQNAYEYSIVSADFRNKYLYCLWWGLQQLSSLGQNLQVTTFLGEIFFAIIIAILGLVLFALLIGNMQTYLQSLGVRLEEWRVKQSDTEEWMEHRQLPEELKERVRQYNRYKWVTTRGVDEETLLQSLPPDLHRDIRRHLCLKLVLQVPLFKQMDDRLLDAICERLKPVLCTKDTVVMSEGEPVNEMVFIIRGVLDSVTTNGGRTGFFNQSKLGPGCFCGEELLTWVLNPKPSVNLPSSTRTVQALEEVEAFALTSEDLKFVATQFRRLHSKKLQHTFRFYSHQWQTWAAGLIQAAWHRYKKKKSLAKLYSMEQDSFNTVLADENESPNASLGATIYASRFAKNALRGVHKLREGNSTSEDAFPKVPKPEEPDFGLDGEEAQDQE